ncbi:hypothetical protein V757_08015 [Pelistega indica]|uniref:YgjP-like metallopeptidase domain-containing protein n=1 Tax=Pelistega indica TaxID=1414851 RepID=V8G179_9BURK|nr:SprT family zinc-dependent metalloprotease [Pelistega indica]ETD70190.1 hypothetical protein V757_08015 [Pelistega indica]
MQQSRFRISTKHGDFEYVIKRRRWQKLSISVGHNGIIVRATLSEPLSNIETMLRSLSEWIANKKAYYESIRPEKINHWQINNTIQYLGKTILLKPHFSNTSPIFLGDVLAPQDNDILLIDIHSSDIPIKIACQQWLQIQALSWFSKRLTALSTPLQLEYSRLRLSYAMRSWGQCNSKKVIGLNWRLIHLPTKQIDYVIAHELAHLKHMNHSKAFWQEVGRIMPDYEIHKKALKQQSLFFLE